MRTARIVRRAVRGAGILAVFALTAAATAQEQRYRERQVLDPNSAEWVDQAPTTQAAPDNVVDQARAELAANHPAQAQALLRKWVKGRSDDERYYEALYLLGETYFERKDFWKALQQYQVVADNASGDLADAANRRCVDVARAFLSGQRRIVWGILRLPAYAEGVDILDRVWERSPGTRLSELALKLKADYHYDSGDVDFAQDDYNNLVQQYPSGRFNQTAMLRSAQAAEAAFPGIRYDDRPLIEADERYRQVQATYPTFAAHESVDERLEGIRSQRAEKDLYVAKWYEKTKRLGPAQFYYRLIVKDYPDTLAATEARTRLRALGAPEEPAAEGAQP